MNLDDALTRLLADLQEEYDFDHVLPLYMFAWSLAGIGLDRSDERFESTCREAYDTFRAAHRDLVLAWSPWPIRKEDITVAAPGTPIDLDLDPDAPPHGRLLVMLPAHDIPPVETGQSS